MSQLAAELRALIDDLVPEAPADTRPAGEGAATDEAAAAQNPAGQDGALRLWNRLCALGLHRVGTFEEQGGSGGSLDDLLVVAEALGSRGAGVPVVEASVADWVMSHAGPLQDGLTTLLLLDEPLAVDVSAEATGHAVVTRAPGDRPDGQCTARLPVVPWARHAARVVLCAPGSAPLLVRTDDPGVTVEPGANLAGEPRDTVVLDAAPVTALSGSTSCGAPPEFDAVRTRLALLWSAALTGTAHGAYRLTKAYVSERHQFGGPLLKLPAVADGLAQMRVQLAQADTAMALAREAAHSGAAGPAVATARVTTSAAATDIARLAHQLHGAMGITREYPLHHFTRRLWAWRDAVDTERHWAESLGRLAAAEGEPGVWTTLTAAAH